MLPGRLSHLDRLVDLLVEIVVEDVRAGDSEDHITNKNPAEAGQPGGVNFQGNYDAEVYPTVRGRARTSRA